MDIVSHGITYAVMLLSYADYILYGIYILYYYLVIYIYM